MFYLIPLELEPNTSKQTHPISIPLELGFQGKIDMALLIDTV